MANEISLTFKLSGSKGGTTVTNVSSTKTQSMSSTAVVLANVVQEVGTSREEIDIATIGVDTTDEYMVLLRNMDATNYVIVELEYSSSNYVVAGRMRPGEAWGPVRFPARSGGYPKLHCTANTAGCNVEIVTLEAGDPAA